MHHQPHKIPISVFASVIILTILVFSVAVLPYLYDALMEAYQLPHAQTPLDKELSEPAMVEEEIQRTVESGRFVRTKPSLVETLTPLRVAGKDFPFEAVFTYGADSFDFSQGELNENFLSNNLSLNVSREVAALVIILELPIWQRHNREGFPDAETFIALLRPETVLAVIEQEDSRLKFFINQNEIVEELARLKEL